MLEGRIALKVQNISSQHEANAPMETKKREKSLVMRLPVKGKVGKTSYS
jgi:hypothetical protein